MVQLIQFCELENSLPKPWPTSLLPNIRKHLKNNPQKLLVLDDDPTGCQTVYDIPIYTQWSLTDINNIFKETSELVYILTNSRSLPLAQAQALNQEVVQNVIKVSNLTGSPFTLVSRSDSTLRGHFPGEIKVLINELDHAIDGVMIIPFFDEGRRLTINDIHYIVENELLIPAAETEYAKDDVFGYHSSNLRDWVCEKTSGDVNPKDVASVGLDILRIGGPKAVAERLMGLSNSQYCVVNAVSYRDLEVFVLGLLQAEVAGKRFIYRTAASFVSVRSGLLPRPLLSPSELYLKGSQAGGLVIAGSYIKKSSAQIRILQDDPQVISIEINVRNLLESTSRPDEITRAVKEASQGISGGKDVLIFTSRDFVKGDSPSESLYIGQSVSDALVNIVQGIDQRPAWIIAKGGITSSDIATKSLGIKRAYVMGQILPGVSVWLSGKESVWPGLMYVVFPGNVGNSQAIVDAVKILRLAQERFD